MFGLRPRAALIVAAVLIGGVAETAQARTLQQVLDRRVFAICAHPDARPYSAREPKPSGLQIDLAEALAGRLGVELREEWVLLRRDARQVGCDAIMAGVAPEAPSDDHRRSTPASAATARSAPSGAPPGQAMSRPYAAQLTRVVFRSGAPPIVSIDDMKGRSIAVPPASFVHYLLDTRGIAVRTLYLAETDILSAVDSGAMEAGVVSEWSLGWYRKMHPQSHLEVLDQQIIDPELDFNVAIVLRNADQALLSRVNEIVGGLMSDGTMGRVFGNYGISYRFPLVR
jgi:polar amino acid transport system substrate-binding protein